MVGQSAGPAAPKGGTKRCIVIRVFGQQIAAALPWRQRAFLTKFNPMDGPRFCRGTRLEGKHLAAANVVIPACGTPPKVGRTHPDEGTA
jgi:hypothetical protein